MELDKSPFLIERRLTPELFDHYVAKARAERAKAIAEFGRQLATAVSRIARRLVRRRLPAARIPLDRPVS